MFPTYMAVLHNGSLEWLGEAPDAPDPTTVLVTLVGEDAPRHQTYLGSNREFVYRIQVEGSKGQLSELIGNYSQNMELVRVLTEQHADDTYVLTLGFSRPVELARLHYFADNIELVVLGLESLRDGATPTGAPPR